MATYNKIDVGGYQLAYQTFGDGEPTVVFECGIEDSSQSLANLAQPMMELHHIQKAQPWVRPGAVQAYTAMQSLHAELAVQMAVWRDAFGLDDVQGLPPITDHAFYQPEEAALVATHFAAMTDTHAKEGIKRANQRANELAGKRGAKRKDV